MLGETPRGRVPLCNLPVDVFEEFCRVTCVADDALLLAPDLPTLHCWDGNITGNLIDPPDWLNPELPLFSEERKQNSFFHCYADESHPRKGFNGSFFLALVLLYIHVQWISRKLELTVALRWSLNTPRKYSFISVHQWYLLRGYKLSSCRVAIYIKTDLEVSI